VHSQILVYVVYDIEYQSMWCRGLSMWCRGLYCVRAYGGQDKVRNMVLVCDQGLAHTQQTQAYHTKGVSWSRIFQCQMNTLVPLTLHDSILWICIVYMSNELLVRVTIRDSNGHAIRLGLVTSRTTRYLPSLKTMSVPTKYDPPRRICTARSVEDETPKTLWMLVGILIECRMS